MSVFTTLEFDEVDAWLKGYAIGHLTKLEGIASGIENTNYFVTTNHGEYVLTVFEKLTAAELPWYLELMAHLAGRGIPCPNPVARLDDGFLGELKGKPACLATRLRGRSIGMPDAADCTEVGELLADLHLAGQSYAKPMANPRGMAWFASTAERVRPVLGADNAAMLDEELALARGLCADALPRGVVHVDLFRDNVLFDDSRLSGVIDFYFACQDSWLYDLAITVNDWCVAADGRLDAERATALVAAYHKVRPLTEAERAAWAGMLRAGALRFWLSRLFDLHFPRPGELVHAKEPTHFERILRHHRGRPEVLQSLLP
ncbi:MAG: homoserine kinase [Betaproteobacteria bacterium]|nr:homoserine kinase [Betaproteobacteria bacterium]